MRRAKDNRQVPKRYYRPEQTTCAYCGCALKRAHQLWRKHINFLQGREWVVNWGYRCSNPDCDEPHRVYASLAARRLTIRGSSFALEVIVQIGYWRFWKRWTVTQIHEVLTQEHQMLISEREVLYLIGVFLVLLRCTYPLRVAEHVADFRRQGLFLAVDALKPEKGNTALYVVRDLTFGLVLHVTPLLSADHLTLEQQVLQPVRALGYRVRGIVSDDEKALVLAVAHVWPGIAHQTCQLHCLQDAATPIAAADQTFKKALKQAMRGPFYAACRALNQLARDDPRYLVLSTYAELIRMTLTEGSKPPFALGGLRVFEDLARLEASLIRSQKKGGIPSWISCWPWFNVAIPSRRNTAASNANATGWWNWIDAWTRPLTLNPARPGGASSDRSRTFWINCASMPRVTRTRPRWSLISARPSSNGGRGSLRVMLGLNVIAPTMIWKLSLAVCAPANAKFRGASRCTSLFCATANGPSSLTPRRPWTKSYNAFSNLTKPSLTRSMPDS